MDAFEGWVKGFVNMMSESRRHICNFKGYNEGFKKALPSSYGCPPYLHISYINKIMDIANVNFGDLLPFEQPGRGCCVQW
jgi:hypothetical protein